MSQVGKDSSSEKPPLLPISPSPASDSERAGGAPDAPIQCGSTGPMDVESAGSSSFARTALGVPHELPFDFGRFEIQKRLGAGSFGVVYLAVDRLLHRHVALKLARATAHDHEHWRERFLRESRAASSLNHPHIVPLYDAGELDQQFYLASQYCPGPDLATWLSERDTPVEPLDAAKLTAELADAVEAAHDSGILHRDVKPSNVLMFPRQPDASGVSSQLEIPKLSDFGLAKFVDQEGDHTQTGILLGTIKYMSPEQARGETNSFSRATDIYSLGVILYEFLTRRVPLLGNNEAETIRFISEREPTPPRRYAPGLPRDLEAICLRCLEKDPARRYATAGDLRDDLHRFIEGRSTLARHIPVHERLLRWTRREPSAAALVLLIVIATFGLLAGLAAHGRRLEIALAEADYQRQQAESQRESTNELLYVANMKLAFQAWNAGDPRQAADQLAKARALDSDIDLRSIDWYLLRAMVQSNESSLEGHEGPAYASVTTTDGRLLATAGEDRTVRLWDTQARISRGVLRGHEDEVNAVAISPDDRWLASASDDRTVRLWDLENPEDVKILHTGEQVQYVVAFSSDGEWLATGGKGGRLHLWNRSQELVAKIELGKTLDEAVFFPGSSRLVVACGEQIVLVDAASGEILNQFKPGQNAITNVAISADGQLIAGAGYGPEIYLYDAQSEQLVAELEGHRGWILDLAFSPDNLHLVSASRDGTVRYWPMVRFQVEAPFFQADKDHRVSVSASDTSLFFGEEDGRVRIYQHRKPIVDKQLSDHGIKELNAGGQHVAVLGDSNGPLRIWRVDPLEQIAELTFSDWNPENVALAQNVCVVTGGREARVWDLDALDGDAVVLPHSRDILEAAISSDGRYLATADKKVVSLWSLETHQRVAMLPHSYRVQAVTFSNDGSLVATGDILGMVRIWNVGGGAAIETIEAHPHAMQALAFSRDDAYLATGCEKGVSRIWDTRSWMCRYTTNSTAAVNELMFDELTNEFVQVTADGQAQRISIESPRESIVIDAHRERAWSIDFSHGGRVLITTGQDGDIKFWQAPIESRDVFLPGYEVDIDAVSFSPSGQQLALYSSLAGMVVCGVDGEERYRFPAQVGSVSELVFATEEQILTVDDRGMLLNWKLFQPEPEVLLQSDRGLSTICVSNHGPELAIGGESGLVLFFDRLGAEPRFSLDLDQASSVTSLRFSPNDRYLAVDANAEVLIYETATGRLVRKLGDAGGPGLLTLDYHPGGEWIAVTHSDFSIRVWNLTTGESETLLGHAARAHADFSVDGNTLVSASDDGTVRLWNVRTWQQIGTLTRQEAAIVRIRFSSDGKYMAAAVTGPLNRGGVMLWWCGPERF